MGLFDSDWQKLHKKLSREYELIALRNYESGKTKGSADVFGIIAEIVKKTVPSYSDEEAAKFIRREYQSFIDFDVRESVGNALRQMKPSVSDGEITEIFALVRRCFREKPKEFETSYFMFFVISKLIEIKKLSITRGAYLMEISQGRIPRPSRFVGFLQRWKLMAHFRHYSKAREREGW